MNLLTNLRDQYAALDEGARKLIMIASAVVLLLLLGFSAMTRHVARLGVVQASREQVLKELLLLQQRHQEASAGAQRLTNRMTSVTPNDSPATIVEQTGMVPKGSMQSKPLPRKERGALIEDGAEVTLSGLSLNETVNLLYRLEQGSKPVTVSKASIRSRFGDPAKLDLVLQIELLRPAAQGQR
ncbi:MAG: hypothetical protein WBI04_03260 [Trichlorobacter sp.]|jgi:general secretion pathway protein M